MNAPSMVPLQAKARTPGGKGAARRVRRDGLIPAVAYGRDLPATPISVPPKEILAILRSEAGKNSVVELALDGKKLLAMVKAFALDPVNRTIEHVDFVQVGLDRPVDVEVPLVPTGKAVGVAKGGVLRVVHRVLPVRCLPQQIPVKIEADVSSLELGQHIVSQDIKLPTGVSIRLPASQTLIAVVAPEKEVEEAPAAVAAQAAAPAAAAPAPDAKKDDKKEDKKK